MADALIIDKDGPKHLTRLEEMHKKDDIDASWKISCHTYLTQLKTNTKYFRCIKTSTQTPK